MHTQKNSIIHRDLKCGNILCTLDENNDLKNIKVHMTTAFAGKIGVTLFRLPTLIRLKYYKVELLSTLVLAPLLSW